MFVFQFMKHTFSTYLVVFSLLLILLNGCKQYYVLNNTASTNVVLNEEVKSEDKSIEEEIKPFRDALKASMDEVLNESVVEMTTGIPEGNLGNFVADLVMDIGEDYYEKINDEDEIDFALLNNGGLRTSLPKGAITRGKVFELMPFENELVVITLSKDKLIELFEFVALKSDTNLSVKKGVPLSKEVKLIINNKKVKEAYIDKESIVSREYRVVTSDYLANGGDKMNFFLNPIKTEKLGVKLRDAILEYIIEEKEDGDKLEAKKDKRISYGK